jgi:outer membrane protein assembly factor BamB
LQSGAEKIQHLRIQSYVILIVFLLIFSSATFVSFAQTATEEWPTAHHDTAHTGYSTSAGPITNQVLWKYTTDWGYPNDPAVAGGRVYFGALDGYMYCVNAATGTLLWSYATNNSVIAAPAIDSGRIYFGSEDGAVYCLDASSGVFVWKHQFSPISSYYQIAASVETSPDVVNGRVYVGSDDDNIYCLNASNGAVLWNYTTGNKIWSSPAVVSSRVYVGSMDNKTYCLNALTGELIWTFVTGGSVQSSPAIFAGRVYVGSNDNNVYCLNSSSGQLLWNYTTGRSVRSSPAVANGKIYVGSDDRFFYCLDAYTGALIWKSQVLANTSAPAVADGKIYVGSSENPVNNALYLNNFVYCLDASDGSIIWKYKTLDVGLSDPAVAYGTVFVGSRDRGLYAFGGSGRTVSAGVSVGDWFKYAVSAGWNSTDPLVRMDPETQKLVNLNWVKIQVIGVSDTNISLSETDYYKNGTDATHTGWVDVETGVLQNVDESLFISTDLSPGSLVYSQNPNAVIQINDVVARNYQSGPRDTDRSKANVSSLYYSNLNVDYQWDKAIGVMVAATKIFSNQTTQMSTTWAILDSSLSVLQIPATKPTPSLTPLTSISPASSSPTSSLSPSSETAPTGTNSVTTSVSPTANPTENATVSSTNTPAGTDNQQMTNSAFGGSIWMVVIIGVIVAIAVSGTGFYIVKNRRSTKRKPGDELKDKIGATGQSIVGSYDHIFISHAEEDGKAAEAIALNLERAGYKTWYYERDNVPGQSYIVVSSQAIVQSKAVVLIISRESLRSNQVHAEVIRTHEAGIPFIPVLNGISHAEFQDTKPEWRLILSSTTSIAITREGVEAVVPRILDGLKGLAVSKKE